MAAVVTAPSAAPSYAPEDPTLPKPWKPLVDGTTGFIYFWNPETNDTQYERPAPSSHKSSVFVSSSVQKPSEGQHYDSNGSLNRGSNHEFSYAKRDQTERSSSDQSGISQESYCCRNEISVTGGDVPAPLTSFEATAFPSEIVREMRYLLQGGAKCRTLFNHPLGASMYVEHPYLVDQNF